MLLVLFETYQYFDLNMPVHVELSGEGAHERMRQSEGLWLCVPSLCLVLLCTPPQLFETYCNVIRTIVSAYNTNQEW